MQILQNVWTALTTENELVLGIISIPFAFLEATLIMLLFLEFFNISSCKKSKILFIFSFSILGCVSKNLIPEPYGTFLNLILLPFIIAFLFKIHFIKAIFCEIIPILLVSIIDSLLVRFFYAFFNISSSDIILIPIYRILTSIVEYIILFIMYEFLKYSKIGLNLLDIKSKEQKIILATSSILGVIIIATQMYISIFYMTFLPIQFILINITSLLAYFAISFYSLININKLNIAKQNLEETRLMNKTLTILNDKIRAFRHDFNNIIQALGGYIQAKDIDGLEKYYSQLLKDCQEVNNLTGLNPEAINNPAIYSLLASKYYLATEKGIEFDLDIFMDLTSIDMKIYEFCRILGILLDNAIQATQECEEKHIKVTIRKDNRCKRQLLIVENTYKEKDIDTEKIFEKGYSTKEGNTGLGLWEVRQILLKNTNLNLFTSKDNTYFKQQLEIYKS